MQIRVKTTNAPADHLRPHGTTDLAENVVGAVLGRFSHRIEDVALHVTHDADGSSDGAVDCRIGARLRGGGVLRASSAAASADSAMRRAAARLRRRLRRAVSRVADSRRRRVPALA